MSEPIQTKQCTKCKQTKQFSKFSKNRNNKDGFQFECKICNAKRAKEYSQTEKGRIAIRKSCLRYSKTEKGKTAQKRRRQTVKYKATHRRYRNSEKGKATKKRYRQTKKYKVAQKSYFILHPKYTKTKIAIHNAIRDGKLPRPDTLQCHYCPAQAEQYHHHKGYAPKHWLDVVPVCKKCHKKCHSE